MYDNVHSGASYVVMLWRYIEFRVFSVCCVNKQPPKALQESDKHHLICGAKTIRARYIDGAAPLQLSSPGVRQHPCREDTCSLCVSNHTPAVPRCLNGLALSLSQGSARRTAHVLPNSLRPIGCSSGSRADGIQAVGRETRGEGSPLPIRAFNMPSRDPLLRTAHTSLECQDNGQQARAVTPHFLCTELSNHDRCRQYRRHHYQGPLHFLLVWPTPCHRQGRRGSRGGLHGKEGTGANLRHLWCGRCCLSLCFTRQLSNLPFGVNS